MLVHFAVDADFHVRCCSGVFPNTSGNDQVVKIGPFFDDGHILWRTDLRQVNSNSNGVSDNCPYYPSISVRVPLLDEAHHVLQNWMAGNRGDTPLHLLFDFSKRGSQF